ncbi:MAG: 3-deoxy-manno-octulosonate cytidylyltransferase [Candidatus Vogelbacteria bacterium CG10_big_fil_rev_8_21_14_0_10_51_16]|uniref:3-deoxy-manno-octulosonate cytidylyltransferase n=1 Tax=Candidatus Vogelbacteria bacterium CG10_big_fil_rev_8_21_14_0_10_51_16 TaxID=1975045 RepID=A0A2H0REU1_9BACT|nr:MAG: 3-deoxy-manno-octulosonate cytidylyltransferase [Candidatus Vogelbacteria bacterium CG10_big_fil_rev_8_21_14_0_10_51_16]
MKYIVVIPARYESSRLPGKPLIKIAGVPMIERTYRQCLKAVPNTQIVIATDDDRIKDHGEAIGANVVMTPSDCKTGTDRVASLLDSLDADVFINVQGDEPIFDPKDLSDMIAEAEKGEHGVVNGYSPITDEDQFRSRTIPKVVFGNDGTLMYMSRSPIPSNKQMEFKKAWRQICVYSFSRKALELFRSQKEKTTLEEIEDIEILRFCELGIPVKMIPLSDHSIAVDVPEDVLRVEKAIRDRNLN